MQRRIPKNKGGIELWKCPACGRFLPRSGFYSDKRAFNGIKIHCRNCHIRISIATRNPIVHKNKNREYMRQKRKDNIPEFRERERLYSKKRPKDIRYYARQMVHIAVKGGFLYKPTKCERCSQEKKITGHHENYSQPLEVQWLCYECHGNR